MQVTTIGLDLAKNVFQVHGATEEGEVVFNRSLRRAQVHRFFESIPRCLVGIEACGTSHYWAREIAKFGHEVRLIPPAYVKLSRLVIRNIIGSAPWDQARHRSCRR